MSPMPNSRMPYGPGQQTAVVQEKCGVCRNDYIPFSSMSIGTRRCWKRSKDEFQVFSELEEEQEWLDHTLDEFVLLAETIRVDCLEPLEHMIDLVSTLFHPRLAD